jgi:hypothetical protein
MEPHGDLKLTTQIGASRLGIQSSSGLLSAKYLWLLWLERAFKLMDEYGIIPNWLVIISVHPQNINRNLLTRAVALNGMI